MKLTQSQAGGGPAPLSRKSFAATLKAGGGDDLAGTVELYAAVFGNVDRSAELIAPGAFSNLDQFVKDGWLAINHNWSDLGIATIESAVQDARGLKITARYHTTPAAQAARAVVKERIDRGKAVKASIGYRVLESESQAQEQGDTVRVLKSIELYEVSIVNLPCNPEAGVSAAKGWMRRLDTAYRALKEGRAISATNRDRLALCRARLAEAAADLEQLLAETDPGAAAPKPMDVQGEPAKSASKPAAAPAAPAVHAMDAWLASQSLLARYKTRD